MPGTFPPRQYPEPSHYVAWFYPEEKPFFFSPEFVKNIPGTCSPQRSFPENADCS
jgi:hypothetical protein